MEQILETKDFLVSGEAFAICKDPNRDLLKTHPVPDDLSPYYKSEDYLSHKDSAKGLMANLYSWVKKYSTAKKIRWIERYAKDKKSLLDVGAGTGELLLAARRNGFQVEGVEPNQDARDLALKKGIQLFPRIEFQGKFQIITLWHVLEHIKDLDEEINKLKALLEDDGALFIAVPNFKSYDAKHYGEFWAAYDVPRHLWHFSRNSIAQLFAQHNMIVSEIKPMPFDAYYISLLSEKYKHGRNRFLKGLYVGFLSNRRARKNGEYSSLLYIIQKQR